MRYLLCLTLAFIGLVTSLSLPTNNRDLLQTTPNSLNHTNATLRTWPDAPFVTKISENEVIDGVTESIFLTIDRYLALEKKSLQGSVMGDISKIEQTIESYGNPGYFIDNSRVFRSGFVNARFPAAKENTNGQRITNGLARELLGAIWGFTYAYGARGFSFATVQSVATDGTKDVVGYFSCWIMTEETTVQNFER